MNPNQTTARPAWKEQAEQVSDVIHQYRQRKGYSEEPRDLYENLMHLIGYGACEMQIFELKQTILYCMAIVAQSKPIDRELPGNLGEMLLKLVFFCEFIGTDENLSFLDYANANFFGGGMKSEKAQNLIKWYTDGIEKLNINPSYRVNNQ